MSTKASGFRGKTVDNLPCIHVIDKQSQKQKAAENAQPKRLHSLGMGWLLLSSIVYLRVCDRLCGFLVKIFRIH